MLGRGLLGFMCVSMFMLHDYAIFLRFSHLLSVSITNNYYLSYAFDLIT